jgi:hypothetical protein
MNYYELFNDTFLNSVQTFTFNCQGDGRNGLGVREIDELTETYVVLSDSISTFRLYFEYLKSGVIELNGIEYTVCYHPEYPNHRFIPVKKHEHNKNLIELFEPDKNDELLMMIFE